jgi:hypothetical protein
MDITALSTDLSLSNIQQSASTQVQKLAMASAEKQGITLVKMMEGSNTFADPSLGNHVNILA